MIYLIVKILEGIFSAIGIIVVIRAIFFPPAPFGER